MRRIVWVLLFLSLIPLTGCAALWHEVQPHRLNRLNRGTAPTEDPDFTVIDRDAPSQLVAMR